MCDLRVGKIVECVEQEGSPKLMCEKIDIGEGQLRTIGSGVRPIVSIAEMKKDAFCVVFANLAAKPLGPIKESQGMVLLAGNEGQTELELVRPPAGSKLGERINLEGNPIGDAFSQEYQPVLKVKKKNWVRMLLEMTKTNGNAEAAYNGIKMVTSGGVITVNSLKECMIT